MDTNQRRCILVPLPVLLSLSLYSLPLPLAMLRLSLVFAVYPRILRSRNKTGEDGQKKTKKATRKKRRRVSKRNKTIKVRIIYSESVSDFTYFYSPDVYMLSALIIRPPRNDDPRKPLLCVKEAMLAVLARPIVSRRLTVRVQPIVPVRLTLLARVNLSAR